MTAEKINRRSAGVGSALQSNEGAAPQADVAATASTAAYIADMCSELAELASRSQLTMLAYFLNLARVEAEMRSRDHGGFEIARHASSRS
ncbi:MAG: hypothetical protein HYS06_07975 [Methylocystis sp.]|nr:hypothetical protein [Methylocystis sp.]MBI3275380.1 hypothetical protein [Methylocystis sp.]